MTRTINSGIDTNAARELDLYAENTAELYPQFLAIIKNVQTKIKRGTYDKALAPKLWLYWYDAAAKRYCAEFGCTMRLAFPKELRQHLACDRASDEYEKIMNGEYQD